jgi:hypothetical protein
MPSRKPSQRASKPARTRKPEVGVFWVFKGRLLKFTKPLEQGYDNGEVVDTDDNHLDVWPKLQMALPQLRVLEYEDVPRGRVLFHKAARRFGVYMDKRLHVQHVKRKIVAAFQLPTSTTDFLTDPHYTTDEAELRLLFDRA